MKHLLLKLEPVIWLLFGQGILIGTMLLTGWILVVGLGVPLGIVSPDALTFARAHDLASSLLGRLFLLALLVLPLWKGAHHVRSLSIDYGGLGRDTAVATVMYLIAAVGSLLAIIAVVRL
ncbi:MAG TPA: fumarate reductase subunit FrdD [Myxococcota bacterium]|jgi:fumarate reductase subunit D|nr:fumarate reductase subunit FrdD [Myxococcota bacterium]